MLVQGYLMIALIVAVLGLGPGMIGLVEFISYDTKRYQKFWRATIIMWFGAIVWPLLLLGLLATMCVLSFVTVDEIKAMIRKG